MLVRAEIKAFSYHWLAGLFRHLIDLTDDTCSTLFGNDSVGA